MGTPQLMPEVGEPECARCLILQERIEDLTVKLANAMVDRALFEEMRERIEAYRDSWEFKGRRNG